MLDIREIIANTVRDDFPLHAPGRKEARPKHCSTE